MSISELQSLLEKSQNIVIATHVNPDGDAIGSSLALGMALRAKGKDIRLVCADAVPQNLRFLPSWEEFLVGRDLFPDDDKHAEFAPFDLLIMVDLNSPSRLAHTKALLKFGVPLAIMDHHEFVDDTPPGIHIIKQDYAASALLIYSLFDELGFAMTPEIAQCLLTGIATDTGSFRFRNSDAKCLRAAADLVAAGASLELINEEIWEKRPLASVKLLKCALENLVMSADGKLAYSTLTLQNYAESGALDEHTEGFVNEVGRVDTARIFALFREHKPNRVRVSVRSRGSIDVSAICKQFGGGGHKNASGCTFETSLAEAVAALVPVLERAALEA